LIAEAANPEWVSVPLVGWQLAAALREVADIHVVTQVRNRDAIARAGWVEGRDFTAIDSEAIARVSYRIASLLRGGEGKGWTTLAALNVPAYYHFEHLLWRHFGGEIQAGRFDVVHRVTPLSPTIPSIIAAKCSRAGVPFVLGPLNGGTPWPAGFEYARRREREWLSYLRGAYKLLPGHRATLAHAAAIVVASRATWDDMPRSCDSRMLYVPENGIDPARFSARRTHRATLPIRLVFVGRLVPYKGADMLLEAAESLLRSGAATLDVIGDGPERESLERIAKERNLSDSVRFRGWIEHRDLHQELAQGDVFAFPSIREFGGGVVLEAMAVGLVPVIVDYGGPGELVTSDSGVAVPIGTRAQVIERMRAALSELAAQPSRIDALSARAIERVQRHFTWACKAEQLAHVYEWVLGKRAKPDFAPPASH
jgi:glycosyltransferase involved in cell wall biosynthesis